MFAQYLERVSVCVTVTCDMLTSMITSAHLCAYVHYRSACASVSARVSRHTYTLGMYFSMSYVRTLYVAACSFLSVCSL